MKHKSDDILHAVQAKYLEHLEQARDALLAKMEALAAQQRQPISDPEVASFLAVVAASMGAKRAIEIGTNIGYGAIVLARAMRSREGSAHVVTIEKSRELCETARDFAKQAGLADAIEVREGTAIDELQKLAGPYDLAYIDCVKEEYPRYLELLAPLIRMGGVVIADNVLWRGLVAAPDVPAEERARVEALREFNRAITSSPFRGVVLPLGDGVAYAVKG